MVDGVESVAQGIYLVFLNYSYISATNKSVHLILDSIVVILIYSMASNMVQLFQTKQNSFWEPFTWIDPYAPTIKSKYLSIKCMLGWINPSIQTSI